MRRTTTTTVVGRVEKKKKKINQIYLKNALSGASFLGETLMGGGLIKYAKTAFACLFFFFFPTYNVGRLRSVICIYTQFDNNNNNNSDFKLIPLHASPVLLTSPIPYNNTTVVVVFFCFFY